MDKQLDFSGKVVLVTGGAKGVGLGITRRFLQSGAQVVVCGRSQPEQLPKEGDNEAVFTTVDVKDVEQIQACIDFIVDRYGRLDVLVNNAGGAPMADAATVSPRFSESIIRLNLIAPLNFSQAANTVMQAQDDGGSIVNIASVSAVRPSPGTAAYGAAKAGLVNLATSLAVEWAPKVRVNSVIAGLIRTEQSHLHYGDEEGIKAVGDSIPLGRMAREDEYKAAIVFLISEASSYMTGHNLILDGGRTAW